MIAEHPSRHLSQLSTCWSVVGRAHAGPDAGRETALRTLWERYGGAAARYLHGALRDPAAAEELCQEFALRFLRGDFRRADPQRGRFRDYLKTALLRLVTRHDIRRQAGPRPLDIDIADTTPTAPDRAEQEFLHSWRAELLARAWQALARFEDESGRPFFQVLRLRVEQPGLSSEGLAALLSARLGRPRTAAAARQTLHRAREAFANLLLDEVAQTLTAPTADELEQELADLNLLEYCRPVLAHYAVAS